ncbi:MAG TPA: Rne/Rng family ribonuclease [Terriglobales bacterium]|nr:Rne/Rng family ribonuclease [Terriglobales bacterium]
MSKELFVSSTPHQTKVALVENDLISEVYFERENEYTLAGSIYKGRVTRVLPGMQSAFVDIGLERDAFLYVSDFFEMEDDDEAIEPIPTAPIAKPFELKPSEPQQRGDSFDTSSVFEGGFSDEGENGAAERNGTASEERQENGGGRRWRGRRRRRGGRDRGFPESKFAPAEEESKEQEVEAAEEPVAEVARPEEGSEQPAYKPIILPGESIAKFNRKPDQQTESAASTEGTQQEPEEERPSERSADRRSRFSRDRDRRPRGFAPRGRGFERDRTEEEPDRPYAPIMLPGESISKYRNLQHQEAEAPAESGESSETVQEEMPHEYHDAVVGSAEFEDVHREAAAHDEEIEETPKDSMIAPVVEEEEVEATHVNPATVESAEEEAAPNKEQEDRFEQMNVASVFGGAATETEEDSGVQGEHDEEEAQEISAAASPVEQAPETDEEDTAAKPSYREAPEGAFEEEEFDADEEDDLPHPTEAFYEPEDYEELEEETLEPMEQAAKELVEAMAETGAIHEISGGYQGEETNGENEDEELDEIENAAYAEIGEPENAHAELRGPSGTAGFQQRPARPEFDRRGGRGRRGRRMGRGAPRREQSRPQVLISEVLKEGQEVLIQIAKEPIGKKGARITSHIALPGRFLVYMPTVNHVGVSRKINSDEERMRLKRIVISERENGHGGFIVRTAAAGISEEDLRNDIRFLKSLWHDIRTRADNSKSPSLIYHDLNLVERTMRDLVTEDFTAIWADTEQEYERINRFVARFQPSLVRRVKLYTKDTPLFEQFGLDAEINKALKSKVWLKSGGYIVINQTEALVAIDINTGKYVGKTSRLEDTIFKTNVDAIKEIVRQIRLRDLGGIIVIDFIDMDERKNRQKVMQALEEEMKTDRAPSKVLQFNDFGLVAITRKRVKQSLERTLGTPCPYCTGNGYVKSPSTVCNEIYVEMRKMAKQFESDILLRVNPEVAKALKANNGRWLMEMEELTGQNILVKSDATLHQEQFDM